VGGFNGGPLNGSQLSDPPLGKFLGGFPPNYGYELTFMGY